MALGVPSGFRLARGREGFALAFLTRMLFSCLVDADFLATGAFYAAAAGETLTAPDAPALPVLRDRLRAHMRRFAAPATEVAHLRAEVLDHAVARAALAPGLFTLTVPTGGGKTLASLSFALEHAVRHGLRRVVYVIPFTSIIEQTAAVFREALGAEAVLEHHANFDWSPSRGTDGGETDADDPGARDALAKLRRAAENWDAPVVVTTSVQFFESLFAHRTSRCRRLHNLAGSVVVLDEAQSLPLPVLRPCLAALEELACNYRASVVLCTATQPALRRQDGFPDGPDIPVARELAPDPPRLYAALKRVEVEVREGITEDAVLAERFATQPQMLCIVNSRAHAVALYDAIRALPGAVHLSTLMVPKHRRLVLADMRARLGRGEPVRLVSTSLLEAGVDVSFPELWRSVAGLDSIAQAAGRCNRHGERPLGRVVVFDPGIKPPRDLLAAWQAARQDGVLGAHRADPLGLAAVRAYFQELYFQKGAGALDALEVGGRRGIMPLLAEQAKTLRFPFRSIGEAFRLIEETMLPVVVPWDAEARRLLDRLRAMERPGRDELRALQQYVVSVPRAARAEWLALGALAEVHPALGDGLVAFGDTALYRGDIGLRLDTLAERAALENIF